MMRRNFRATTERLHPLTEVLNHHRLRSQKRQADMARDCWLDESYISRLFSGERTAPSRDALILLAVFGLELALEETDEVLMAADYKPLALLVHRGLN